MNIIKSKYRAWKKNNPLDRQYDEIGEFMAELSRGELLMIMDNTLRQEEPNHAQDQDSGREDEEVPDELWRESN